MLDRGSVPHKQFINTNQRLERAMNLKKFFTLMKKDIMTCFANKSSLLMLVTPLCFCIFYSWIVEVRGNTSDMAKHFVLLISCDFNLSIIPVSILPTLIAEEKEKGTMDALYRAGVRNREFICAKMAAVMTVLLGMALIMFVITKTNPAFLALYLLLHILITIVLLPIGLIVGVIARDQNGANVYSTLPVVILMACPVFTYELGVLEHLSAFLPTNMLSEILILYIEKSVLFSRAGLLSLVCCMVWGALGIYVFLRLYRKYGLGIGTKRIPR
ncbi:MAG: ABC transporter permease [Lachnospiraceae bacterium]|nr:ABC transporter permease [Lachnospiraceae bacterium]